MVGVRLATVWLLFFSPAVIGLCNGEDNCCTKLPIFKNESEIGEFSSSSNNSFTEIFNLTSSNNSPPVSQIENIETKTIPPRLPDFLNLSISSIDQNPIFFPNTTRLQSKEHNPLCSYLASLFVKVLSHVLPHVSISSLLKELLFARLAAEGPAESPSFNAVTLLAQSVLQCLLNCAQKRYQRPSGPSDFSSVESQGVQVRGIIEFISNSSDADESYNSESSKKFLFGRERGNIDIENEDVEQRIIGGQVALPGEFPHQVALYKGSIFECGSSLISKFFVLTAGHCLHGTQPQEVWFRVGSNLLEKGGEIYHVENFIIHQHYNDAENDIGLVKSASEVQFGPNVQPVKLPCSSDPPLAPGDQVVTSGWGATSLGNLGLPSYKLQKLELRVASPERCRNRMMASARVISNRQLCTDAPVKAGTCFGDSGGPLVSNGKLVGIVSWGSPCAIGDPDVYTNVRMFLPWIYQHIIVLNSESAENTESLELPLDPYKLFKSLVYSQ